MLGLNSSYYYITHSTDALQIYGSKSSEEVLGKAESSCRMLRVQEMNANGLRQSVHLLRSLGIHLAILFMDLCGLYDSLLEVWHIIHLREEPPDWHAVAQVWLIPYRKEQAESPVLYSSFHCYASPAHWRVKQWCKTALMLYCKNNVTCLKKTKNY